MEKKTPDYSWKIININQSEPIIGCKLKALAIFFAKKHKNIWSIQKKAVPLQPNCKKECKFGTLPERLGIGLQNRGRRFESARYLRRRAAQ